MVVTAAETKAVRWRTPPSETRMRSYDEGPGDDRGGKGGQADPDDLGVAATAAHWDRRVDRVLATAPDRMRRGIVWLKVPRRRAFRIVVGALLVLGGIFSILPLLGVWMLPLGLALLGEDLPWLKVLLERTARQGERAWA